MAFAFRSIGSLGFQFNASITPGAPAGFQAGDTLVVAAFATPGSYTLPDLTSYGFTRRSLNSAVTWATLYTKVASGGDTMPTFQYGADYQGVWCLAYSGGPPSVQIDKTAVERSTSTTTQGAGYPAFTAPPTPGDLLIGLSVRGNGSATGVTWGSLTNFTNRATQVTDNRVHAAINDWIQTTPSGFASIQTQSTSPSDSLGQSAQGSIIFLQPGQPIVPFPPMNLGGIGVQMCQ